MKKTIILMALTMLVLLPVAVALGCQPQAPPVGALPPTPTPTPAPPPAPAPTPAPAPAPPQPEPTPEPTPKPSPEPPTKPPKIMTSEEIMRWLASDIPEVDRAMLNLNTKYPVKDSKPLLEYMGKKDNPYYGFLVSQLNFGDWFSFLRADLVDEARKHIDNANSLIQSKKLPGESRPREVGKEEISGELASALLLLKQQVDYSLSHQEGNIAWARAPDNPRKLKDWEFSQLIEVYDNYRAEISNVTTKLEFILSYCPGHKQTGGSI